MITTIIYFITFVIVGLFSYKCYLAGYAKGLKNNFANYLFLSSLFISLSYLAGGILTLLSVQTLDDSFIYYYNYVARILFYTSAVFAVQVPLYKYYPNDKRRYIFSFIAAIAGVALLTYQHFYTNQHPTINGAGIVNWDTSIVLSLGMMCMMLVPWAATSIVFFIEFINNKFASPKPFLLGSGFLLICIGGFFTDNFINSVTLYVIFSALMIFGFLFCLAGLFYED